MAVRYLLTDREYGYTHDETTDQSWEAVEAAIRALDAEHHTLISLSPIG